MIIDGCAGAPLISTAKDGAQPMTVQTFPGETGLHPGKVANTRKSPAM
jgi:hypothetical protein